MRALTRRINTYLYLALVPADWPTDQHPKGEDRLEAAIRRLGELWDDEYLPEIQRHLQHWEALDPACSTMPQLVDALEESVARTKRLYEIHFLIWLPFMTAISLFDDFYRRVLGGSDFAAYRLLQGFDEQDGGERAKVVAAQPAGAPGRVGPCGPGARGGRSSHHHARGDARRAGIPRSPARLPRGVGPAR